MKQHNAAMTQLGDITNSINSRAIELFELKYTRQDFENGVRGTKSYMNKCKEQAGKEVWRKVMGR